MIKFTATPYGVKVTGLPGQAKRRANLTFKNMPNGDLLVSVRAPLGTVIPACVVANLRDSAMKAAEAALGRWPETLNDVRQLCR